MSRTRSEPLLHRDAPDEAAARSLAVDIMHEVLLAFRSQQSADDLWAAVCESSRWVVPASRVCLLAGDLDGRLNVVAGMTDGELLPRSTDRVDAALLGELLSPSFRAVWGDPPWDTALAESPLGWLLEGSKGVLAVPMVDGEDRVGVALFSFSRPLDDVRPVAQMAGLFGLHAGLAHRLARSAEDLRRLAALPEESPNPVIEMAQSGEVTYANAAARRRFPDLEEQGVKHPLLDGLAGRRWGTTRWVISEVEVGDRIFERRAYSAPEGGRLRLYAIDITQRRKTEEALIQRTVQLEASNRELDQFASVAAHDLREPLRKLSNYGTKLASRVGESDPVAGEHAARIVDAATRMDAMLTNLLALSKISSRGRAFERIQLTTAIGVAVEDLDLPIRERGAEVRVGEMPAIEADPSQLHQLFLNLVNNALKFVREGVTPVVEVSARSVMDRVFGEAVEITVADNGIGFRSADAENIFKAFKRLHPRGDYPGTGLGLAICQRIVERHGGTIRAEGEPGQGARFIITLPVVPIEA